MNDRIVKQAKSDYSFAVKLLKNAVDYIEHASRGVYTPEKQKAFLRTFYDNYDFILQLSMFQIGVADGNLDKDEVIFIKNLVEFSDFCEMCKKHFDFEISWYGVFDNPTEKMAKIVKSIGFLNNEKLDYFAKYLSTYYYNHPREFEDFTLYSFRVLDAIAGLDGDYSGKEEKLKYNTYFGNLRDKITGYMKMFKK